MKRIILAAAVFLAASALVPASAQARDVNGRYGIDRRAGGIRTLGFAERRVVGRGYAGWLDRSDSGIRRGVGYKPLGVGPGLGLVYGAGSTYGNGY